MKDYEVKMLEFTKPAGDLAAKGGCLVVVLISQRNIKFFRKLSQSFDFQKLDFLPKVTPPDVGTQKL
uniref:Uncharacterized protein n=1 Tax=Romanomermis culicivorax TaxID=13658 RepID=A0A915JH82_ROMCU